MKDGGHSMTLMTSVKAHRDAIMKTFLIGLRRLHFRTKSTTVLPSSRRLLLAFLESVNSLLSSNVNIPMQTLLQNSTL